MSERDPKTISDQLCQYARSSLLAEGVVFDEHTPLAEAGIDSYALVEMLLFSERQFGIKVPESHLTREHLTSTAALARCIAGLAGAH